MVATRRCQHWLATSASNDVKQNLFEKTQHHVRIDSYHLFFMIYNFTYFTSVNDNSDSIPFCYVGGIDSSHTLTRNIHTYTFMLLYPHAFVDSMSSIDITWWTPRMANMC